MLNIIQILQDECMSSWELNKMVVMHFIWLEFHQSAMVSLHKVTHFPTVCVCACMCVCVLQVAPSLPRLHPVCSPQPLLPLPPPCTRPPPPSGSVRCRFWTAAHPMPYWTPLPMTSSPPTPTCSVHSPPSPVRVSHCTAAFSIITSTLLSPLSAPPSTDTQPSCTWMLSHCHNPDFRNKV